MSSPWRWFGGARKCPHSHSLPACPPALCYPRRAGDVTTKPAELFSIRCAPAHICMWRCHGGLFRRLAHLCGWSSSVPSSICLPFPLGGTASTPPPRLLPGHDGPNEPRGHQSGGCRALFAFPPLPTWQEQVKGDAGRGPAAGRASRSSFSTSHLTPARPSAHVLTTVCAPHDPLAGAVRQPLHVRRSPRRLSISILRATLRTAAWSKRGPSCAERGPARGSERGSQGGAPGAGRAM